jgi:hypothetical protein
MSLYISCKDLQKITPWKQARWRMKYKKLTSQVPVIWVPVLWVPGVYVQEEEKSASLLSSAFRSALLRNWKITNHCRKKQIWVESLLTRNTTTLHNKGAEDVSENIQSSTKSRFKKIMRSKSKEAWTSLLQLLGSSALWNTNAGNHNLLWN